jgi:hypothetical protein
MIYINMFNKVLNEINKDKQNYMFVFLIALFIILNIDVPQQIAELLDNIIVKALLYLAALFLLSKHRVLGAVALIGVYELIRRSEIKSGTNAIKKYLPTQIHKDRHLSAMNQFPTTLEEEIVSNMVPLVNNAPLSKPSYKPVLSANNSASTI